MEIHPTVVETFHSKPQSGARSPGDHRNQRDSSSENHECLKVTPHCVYYKYKLKKKKHGKCVKHDKGKAFKLWSMLHCVEMKHGLHEYVILYLAGFILQQICATSTVCFF